MHRIYHHLEFFLLDDKILSYSCNCNWGYNQCLIVIDTISRNHALFVHEHEEKIRFLQLSISNFKTHSTLKQAKPWNCIEFLNSLDIDNNQV